MRRLYDSKSKGGEKLRQIYEVMEWLIEWRGQRLERAVVIAETRLWRHRMAHDKTELL